MNARIAVLMSFAIANAPSAVLIGQSIHAGKTSNDFAAELGDVTWLRSWESASDAARNSGKPIAIVFQEIPGCQTCKDFGCNVLGHPLIVEAMEDCFVPLLIHNNRPGADEATLKKFAEPAWNNPVVRYVTCMGQDVLPRADGVWTASGTAQRMIQALEKSNLAVPDYLRFIPETDSISQETAVFAMHCFWEGEARLGGLRGVSETRSGWIGSREVVRVNFDPRKIELDKLLRKAQELECATAVFARDSAQLEGVKRQAKLDVRLQSDAEPFRDAQTSDQHYYLRKHAARWLPLTTIQATKINAAIPADMEIAEWLSPRQLKLLERISEILAENPLAFDGLTELPDEADLVPHARRLNDRIKRFRTIPFSD
jgi:hypothetical protein